MLIVHATLGLHVVVRDPEPDATLRPSLGTFYLVTHSDKVRAQLLDCVCGCAGLYGFWIVCNQERLFGLDNDNAFSSLCRQRL